MFKAKDYQYLTVDLVRKYLEHKGWKPSEADSNGYSHPQLDINIRLPPFTIIETLCESLTTVCVNAEGEKDFKDFVKKEKERARKEKARKQVFAMVETANKAERGEGGRFLPGNKIGALNGVKSSDIRKHRTRLNENVDEVLDILVEEALVNKNIEICKWIVDKVVPNSKAATYTNYANKDLLISKLSSLTELKEQSAETIKSTLKGDSSIEEAEALIAIYKEHKALIEAADIEPLAQELAKRMGR